MNIKSIYKGMVDFWLSLTIVKKIRIFMSAVFLIISLSILFDAWVVKYALDDFQNILKEDAGSINFMDAIENEEKCFEKYINDPVIENQYELNSACLITKKAVESLPFNYNRMSEERYLKTWSIKNSYEAYSKKRDSVLILGRANPNYIDDIYSIYDMQDYILEYAKTLMRYTLEDGTNSYISKIKNMYFIPVIVTVFAIILVLIVVNISNFMNNDIVHPIIELANASRKIASNNYNIDDIIVRNKDEVGELTKAFNKMKESTSQYIDYLNEKKKMAETIHRAEVDKLKAEKQVETINLQLLKNQIDPHFLFNTLNVISGMAVLEEAETTEKMINVMSSLFRYNLKNNDLEVSLSQEIRVVNDYMYLQEMRFGDRIKYSIENKVDEDSVIVPTYILQPLLENSIKHGLSKKEQGGYIIIRIWKEGSMLIITIVDNGLGMPKDHLDNIRKELIEGKTKSTGIGLRNIYKRIKEMYIGGSFEIYSIEGKGTAIKIIIPQNKEDRLCIKY